MSLKQRRQSTVFTAPEWCGRPQAGVHVEVCRITRSTGEEERIGRFSLEDHEYYIFGTNKEVCDVTLDHPSSSRTHLAVVHHKEGGVYVVDLGSTHGTFLSGTRLPSAQPVEWPDGEKLRTGMSSRYYMLRKKAHLGRVSKEMKKDVADFVAAIEKEAEDAEAKQVLEKAHEFFVPTFVCAVEPEGPSAVSPKKSEHPEPPPVQVSHILIKHQNCARPEWKGNPITRTYAEAVKLAEGIRVTILDDTANFAAYAKKYSECASGKKRGGELPPMQLSQPGEGLQPLFDALRSLSVGGISTVVETELGLHILMRGS